MYTRSSTASACVRTQSSTENRVHCRNAFFCCGENNEKLMHKLKHQRQYIIISIVSRIFPHHTACIIYLKSKIAVMMELSRMNFGCRYKVCPPESVLPHGGIGCCGCGFFLRVVYDCDIKNMSRGRFSKFRGRFVQIVILQNS